MLKIKLIRFGKKNQPHYRIVVQEARTKRDGKYTALLGNYAPTQTPKQLTIDLEAYQRWVGQGAQPTPTVKSLVTRYESGNPFPAKKKKPSKKQLAKQAAAEGKKAEDEQKAETASSQEAATKAETKEKTENEDKTGTKAGGKTDETKNKAAAAQK